MRLLLSVIGEDEALDINNFADVIDIKDPSKGPLGAPNQETVRGIRNLVGPDKIISVALGDASADYKILAVQAMTMANKGANIIKIALADIASLNPVDILSHLRDTLPMEVKLIACAYADGAPKGFMAPKELPYIATLSGADGILIDTCNKTGSSLFDSLTTAQLEDILERSKKLGLITALAGSLKLDHIEKLALLAPEYIGFRSAITTQGDRSADGVDKEKAMILKEKIASMKVGAVL